jgi:hypothetical protein
MPDIPPVEAGNIPAILKDEKRWLGWWAGPLKPNGKFDKFPVDPWTGRKIDPLAPGNWLTFDQAIDACRRGTAKGVGIVLSDQHPVSFAGTEYYLTAVDLDGCGDRMPELQSLWRQLGRPYVEVSPSGKGLRILGLSRTPFRGGNAGEGRELYFTKRFVTVTGLNGRGTLCDFTNEIEHLEQQWFRNTRQNERQSSSFQPPSPELREHIAPVLSMLDAVSPDTTYEIWRDIVWSIASTGWTCARDIAHKWSRKAPHRYDGAALDQLLNNFDPSRGIRIGTLVHHARQNGWSGNLLSLTTTQSPPALLMTACQLRQIPATPYVIRGILPAHGLAAIYGEPGSGKSFIALHLAHAVATGSPDWFGFPVQQAPVVYVALEGQGGIGRRISALEMHSKQPCPDGLRFSCQDVQLLSGDGIDGLATAIVEALGQGPVIIIDTLNQASPGADENSSQDMGKIIANAKRLATATGGLVVLVHHAGKDRSRGLRGHSSLLAAMDAVIEVVKESTGRNWSIKKAKDDSADEARDFDLVPYEVGQDAYGPISSCAVQQAVHAKTPKRSQPTGKNQKAAMTKLRCDLPASGQSMDYKAVVKNVAAVLDVPKGKEHDRAKEAVDALVRAGHLSLNEGNICLA